jgi:hypothetical protein
VFSDEDIGMVTAKVIAYILRTLRDQIHSDKNLAEGIMAASSAAGNAASDLAAQPVDPGKLSRFINLWIYACPSEDVIRTGDILALSSGGNETLILVLTPPCDLEDFWKKTRGCLTFIQVEHLMGDAVRRFRVQQPQATFTSMVSIQKGSEGPILLPALRISREAIEDYVIFSHRVQSIDLDKPEKIPPVDKGGKEQVPPKKLTVTVLQAALGATKTAYAVRRECRVCEPFRTAVINHISRTLFQNAFPDLPAEEASRVNQVFAQANVSR